jgi:hypothetical protein
LREAIDVDVVVAGAVHLGEVHRESPKAWVSRRLIFYLLRANTQLSWIE